MARGRSCPGIDAAGRRSSEGVPECCSAGMRHVCADDGVEMCAATCACRYTIAQISGWSRRDVDVGAGPTAACAYARVREQSRPMQRVRATMSGIAGGSASGILSLPMALGALSECSMHADDRSPRSHELHVMDRTRCVIRRGAAAAFERYTCSTGGSSLSQSL